MTDEADVSLWCTEHDQYLKSVEYGPLVLGLPNTWESITYGCGCTVRPTVAQFAVADLVDSFVRQDFRASGHGA